jgi:hypothetical protein
MPSLTEKRNAAGDRYAAAVVELRAAFVALSALDRLLEAPSFGPAPLTVPLRHPTYLPDLSGSLTDGVAAAIEAYSA